MTTIAYKDGILAADSQETIGGMAFKSAPKITVIENTETIIAMAGESDKCVAALNFFSEPDWREKVDEAPIFKKGFEAIIITKERPYYCINNCIPIQLGGDVYACGSGWQIAMAAMRMGLSAVDAVKFAGELNIWTNQEVQAVNVKDVFKSKETKRPGRIARGKAVPQT